MAVKSLAQSSLSKPQRHRSMLAGYETNKFHHLETIRLSSSASSVEFTNLGQYSDFNHFQIQIVSRSDRPTGSNTNVDLVVNADTGANYSRHSIYYTTSLGAGALASSSKIYLGPTSQPASGSDVFNGMTVDIFDPFETTKYTTVRAWGGFAAGAFMLTSGVWRNTNAVTSLEIICEPSNNFVAGSRFSLYGWKVGP